MLLTVVIRSMDMIQMHNISLRKYRSPRDFIKRNSTALQRIPYSITVPRPLLNKLTTLDFSQL
jgi:hypothetical protein